MNEWVGVAPLLVVVVFFFFCLLACLFADFDVT